MFSKDKKKKSLIKNCLNTVISWYVPDENDRVNRPAQILCNAAILSPIILIEGIKIGIYDSFAPHSLSGFGVLGKGLATPLFSVIKMKQSAAFGTATSFAPQYLIVMLVFFISITIMLYVDADRNKEISHKKDGDMQFASIKKYNKELAYPLGEEGFSEPSEEELNSNAPGNMIISKNARYSLAGTPFLYSCAFIQGPTGSGKSFRWVKPNILQMNSSYVITDPKCELIESLGTCLMEHGYDVRLFNLKKGEQKYSCRYNPFNYINDEQDVILTVDAFLEASSLEGGTGGDPFFPIAEKNFYYALFYYVYTVLPKEKRTLKAVYELYAQADESDKSTYGQKDDQKRAQKVESIFDKKFKEVAKKDPTNPCLSFYKTFKNGSPKTKQSILISVGVKLWFLSVPETANLLSADDLNFEMMGDRKMALFVAIPTDSDSFKCLSAMMFTQLFQTLYYVGETVNPNSFLLQKGVCVALRSKQFIKDTKSETEAKAKLEAMQEVYKNAFIIDENELRKTDASLNAWLNVVDENGISPWPKVSIVVLYEDYPQLVDEEQNKFDFGFKLSDDGKYVILEEFKSRRAAEIVLDAAKNGTIKSGSKSHVNRIRFILDEFFAIGKIVGFDSKIATFRSLKISTDIILQGKTQLAEMYDDKDGKILGNCDLKVCLGAAEYDDADYFSKLCGQTTVRSTSTNIDHKNGVIATSNGGSISDNAQMLVRPEFLLGKMKGDECLVFTRTQGAFKDKKYDATKHPRWKETYSDRDPETFDKRFSYRKMFYITQNKNNLIRTVFVEENAFNKDVSVSLPYAKSSSNDPRPNVNPRKLFKPYKYNYGKNRDKSEDSFFDSVAKNFGENMTNDGLIKEDALPEEQKERLKKALAEQSGEYKVDPVTNTVALSKEEFLGDMVSQVTNVV